MESSQSVGLPGIPFELRWEPPPERWELVNGSLKVRAGALTDLFRDPSGSTAVGNAPRLLGLPVGDFLLSTRLTVEFAARFDAGALVLVSGDDLWGKLCFEYSPLNEPTVVSVVTRGVSDDCNSCAVSTNTTWLRVGRRGGAFSFHASSDGETWLLVRHFALGPAAAIKVGFLAQSPTGGGCTVTFDHMRHRAEGLRDLRSGE